MAGLSDYVGLEDRVRASIEDGAADGIPFRARTAHMHATWARTFSSLPELYIQPESQAEVEKAIRLARLCRRRLTTVGHGHSPSDLTCTSSWMVNLDRLGRVLSVDKATGLVVVEAGIRLHQLTAELRSHGLAMAIQGSVDEQSMAGVISTGTRGSSLKHGLLSERVTSLKIALANGQTETCSATENTELFRAALLSLGALGIITELTFQAVPQFAIKWHQTIDSDAKMLSAWDKDLWTQTTFVRVWWLPYTRRAVVWKGEVVTDTDLATGKEALLDPPFGWYDGPLGYHVYHNLLALARWVPRIVPWIEWLIFGLQYGFGNGERTTTGAVQNSSQSLLMNCLYSQYVTEWAIPLDRGPEALLRLGSWLNRLKPGDRYYVPHAIPFSVDGIYAHAPLEVRVCNSNIRTSAERGNRPFLDFTLKDGPTLNLNATMYRPYLKDPPKVHQWFRAFEWLMRDLGGKPHWAKNFEVSGDELAAWYGDDLKQWQKVRDAADPDGLMVGAWHRKHVLDPDTPLLPIEELERSRSDGGRAGGTTVHCVPNSL